jgi:hypothetical protein
MDKTPTTWAHWPAWFRKRNGQRIERWSHPCGKGFLLYFFTSIKVMLPRSLAWKLKDCPGNGLIWATFLHSLSLIADLIIDDSMMICSFHQV